jgi:DNA-binding CsgD family transcriptional regulator
VWSVRLPAKDENRPLSRREREVVRLLLDGATVKEVAARLELSPRTVETYLQRLKTREHQPRVHALLAQLVRTGRA